MPHQLQFEQWIPVPLTEVFVFFANPENLPRIMAPSAKTKIDGLQLVPPADSAGCGTLTTHKLAGKGSVIHTSFRPMAFLPLRRKWVAAIVEFEWNDHFVDVQQDGPFRQWRHRHEFRADVRNGFNGTLLRDVIEYEMGFGVLGSLANSWFVERNLRSAFSYRQKELSKLLNAYLPAGTLPE